MQTACRYSDSFMENMYSTIGENMRYFMYKYKFNTYDW